MRAGTGKAEIRLPAGLLPLEKFTAVQDPLSIRVLLLEAGATFALVSAEMTSLREYMVHSMKEAVIELTGLPENHIWICVTHTFSAPHTRSEQALQRGDEALRRKNQALVDAILTALRAAVRQAQGSLREVTPGIGTGPCTVNVNRDVQTPQGWWLGRNPQGFANHTVRVLCLHDRQTGKPAAILFNCDVQSSVMEGTALPGGGSPISGDLAGAACTALETGCGPGVTAIFLPGGAGDQAPREQAEGPAENGRALCQRLGGELAGQVMRVLAEARPAAMAGTVLFQTVTARLPGQKIMEPRPASPLREYAFPPAEPRDCGAELVLLGDVALVGVKPELSGVTAHELRSHSPYGLTLVVTMVNGGDKYMPERSAYDRITYEAMNSGYGRGAAEQLTEQVLQAFRQDCP